MDNKIIEFPKKVSERKSAENLSHAEIITLIEKMIDSYMNVRLSLSVKAVINNGITKKEKDEVIESAKKQANDLMVSEELDYYSAIIDELYKQKQSLSMEDMEKAINGNNYSDTGQEKGVSLIKRDGHFKNPIDELDKAV